MFKFSPDSFLKRQQEINDDKTCCLIKQYVNIYHSQEIENIFDKHCNSISYLIDFVSTIKNNGFQIIVPCIGRDENSTTVRRDIEKGFSITDRRNYNYIPFIRFTFIEKQILYGVSIKELYMLFFNKENKFEDSEEKTLYYLNKFNKMKAFI
jgi:hypothetical protein